MLLTFALHSMNSWFIQILSLGNFFLLLLVFSVLETGQRAWSTLDKHFQTELYLQSFMSICMYVCMHVHMYICKNVYMYVCMHIHMYESMYLSSMYLSIIYLSFIYILSPISSICLSVYHPFNLSMTICFETKSY